MEPFTVKTTAPIDFNADPSKYGPFKVDQISNKGLAEQAKKVPKTTLGVDVSKFKTTDN